MPQWLVDILGEDLAPIGRVALAALVVILLAMLMIWLAKKAFGGMTLGARGRQAPRLAVADILAVDDKRRLILVRRDETEHLVLVGGANDLLLEAGIRQTESVLAPRREPGLATRPFATDRYVEDRDDEENEPPAPRGASERLVPPPPPPPPVRVESDRREPISASLAEALAAAAADTDRSPARRPAEVEDDAAKTRLELEAALMAARAAMPDLSVPSRASVAVPPVPPPSGPAPAPAERSLAENDGGVLPEEPAEPMRRPLSVRSFATAIQNRKPSAPQPAAAPSPENAPAGPIVAPVLSPAPAARPLQSQATPVAAPMQAPRPAAPAPQPAPTTPPQPTPVPAPTQAPVGLHLRPPAFAQPQRAPSPAAPPSPLAESVPPRRPDPEAVSTPAQAPVVPPVTTPVFSAPQPAPVASVAPSTPPRAQAPAPVVAPPVGELSKPERRESTIEDFLAAELDIDFRGPDEPTRPAPVPAPEVRSPVEPERSAPEPKQARADAAEDAPAAARKLTLEEEMERLLGDFSASTSFTTRR